MKIYELKREKETFQLFITWCTSVVFSTTERPHTGAASAAEAPPDMERPAGVFLGAGITVTSLAQSICALFFLSLYLFPRNTHT